VPLSLTQHLKMSCCDLLGEDYSVDRYWLRDGLRDVIGGGGKRASIGFAVNAEGLSLISMKARERATAPRQMATAIIAPTTSPQVARSSIRGSCAFMLLSFQTKGLAERAAPPT
jgi:hypothetical protein